MYLLNEKNVIQSEVSEVEARQSGYIRVKEASLSVTISSFEGHSLQARRSSYFQFDVYCCLI